MFFSGLSLRCGPRGQSGGPRALQAQDLIVLVRKGYLLIGEIALQGLDILKRVVDGLHARTPAQGAQSGAHLAFAEVIQLMWAVYKGLVGLLVPKDYLLEGVGVSHGEYQAQKIPKTAGDGVDIVLTAGLRIDTEDGIPQAADKTVVYAVVPAYDLGADGSAEICGAISSLQAYQAAVEPQLPVFFTEDIH